MNVNQIKKEANAFKQDIEDVATAHAKYYKLWLFRFTIRLLTNIFWSVFFAVLFIFALVFFAIAGAFAFSDYLGSMPLGFSLVGGILVVITLLVYFLAGKRINKMWLRKLSEIYFQE